MSWRERRLSQTIPRAPPNLPFVMALTIKISVSDSLGELIQSQATVRGIRSLDECASAILAETVTSPAVMPSDPRELAAELHKGLVGEGRALSDDDWAQKEANVLRRHPERQAG